MYGQLRQRRPPKRGRRWWAAPVLAGLALIVVAVGGILISQPRLPSAGSAPAWAQPSPPTQAPATQAPAAQAPAAQARAVQAPAAPAMPAVLPVGARSVSLPSLQKSAPAVPVSARGGALGVPDDEAHVGWWMPSSAELVIDGHVDLEGAGPGALYNVRNLQPGAPVVVQTADGPEHWTIDGVRTYRKGQLPSGLFGWAGPTARLVLITCGGPFDYATHHYDDNVVAYASPRTEPATSR
jgi:hypothetical protein